MTKLERMDWESTKSSVIELLRQHMMGVEINQILLEYVEKQLESFPQEAPAPSQSNHNLDKPK